MLVSAAASGEGKTTVTAALARYHRNRGLNVRVFKTGPDFLDPMILAQASGNPVYQLDLWMVGEAHCKQLLYQAAGEADIILVEGVMGLFDGNPSSADLAQRFGLPVLGVINASAMAQTFGAVALGLASYRPELTFAGVFANGVASVGHGKMLMESLPAGIRWLGGMARTADFTLPERHLGLLQAGEIADLDGRLDAAAASIASNGASDLPPPVAFHPVEQTPFANSLAGLRIAIARDHAFGFLYQANLDLLKEMGAELRFFSPLHDAAIPEADSLYLPGGYPELHLSTLAGNTSMKQSLRQFFESGKPILAECGGMMCLFDTLTDKQGNSGEMAGLLPGKVVMQQKLAGLGSQSVILPEGELRGHTFHYSKTDTRLTPIAHGQPQRHGSIGEAVYRQGRLTTSYLHLYFPSNPAVAASLFLP